MLVEGGVDGAADYLNFPRAVQEEWQRSQVLVADSVLGHLWDFPGLLWLHILTCEKSIRIVQYLHFFDTEFVSRPKLIRSISRSIILWDCGFGQSRD